MTLLHPLVVALSVVLCAAAHGETAIRIDPGSPGARLDKNLQGQFAEHLGRGIYGGLWVGPDAEIPNTRGWRNDVVAALKELRVPVVRWPGGCFADTYHWRDGIGPRERRPVRVNTLWGGAKETNAVGTHEFFDLAEQLGAEAYVNGNLGTGTPQEMAEWLEYLTADGDSELVRLRRANGRDEPFPLHHFGIGNEAWGCGGHMSPEYYTNLYKHWGSFLRPPWDSTLRFVASGGHGEGTKDRTRWSAYLTEHIEPDFLLRFDAVSLHYYTHPKGNVWSPKGAATGFPEAEWMSTLVAALEMRELIADNKAVMDEHDPEKKIALYVDEWGTWYDPEEGTNPGFLVQQNSLRDAVVAALTLHVFHEHADRVRMANIAQMVDVLQAMVITQAEAMVRTPTYFAFRMYRPFQGATSLPVQQSGGRRYTLGDESLPAISATAALGKDGKILLALVNVDPHLAETVTVSLASGDPTVATGEVLTADRMDAHNTFAEPRRVARESYSAVAAKGQLVLEIPPKAVVVVTIE